MMVCHFYKIHIAWWKDKQLFVNNVNTATWTNCIMSGVCMKRRQQGKHTTCKL